MKGSRRRGDNYQVHGARAGYRTAGVSRQADKVQDNGKSADGNAHRTKVLLEMTSQAYDQWRAAMVHVRKLEEQGRTAELKAARQKAESLHSLMGMLMDELATLMNSDPTFEQHLYEMREPLAKTTLMAMSQAAFAIEPIGMQCPIDETWLYFNVSQGTYELRYRGYVSVVHDSNLIQATKDLMCSHLDYELPFSQATCEEWRSAYHDVLEGTIRTNRRIIEERFIKSGDTN